MIPGDVTGSHMTCHVIPTDIITAEHVVGAVCCEGVRGGFGTCVMSAGVQFSCSTQPLGTSGDSRFLEERKEEGGKEGGRKGGRQGGMEAGKEGGRDGGREGVQGGGTEEGEWREGGRKRRKEG